MTKEGTLREAFDNAVRLLGEHRPDLAREQLVAVLEQNPHEVNALRLLGVIELARGDAPAAIEHLRHAVDRAPAFTQAAVDLARAYVSNGQPSLAEASLEDTCKQQPNHAEAWQLLGDVKLELNKPAEGQDAYRRAVELDAFRPQMRDAVNALGSGRGRTAEKIFRDILKRDGNHVHALVGLASIALDAGVLEDAERLINHGLKQSPNMDSLWRCMARLRLERSDITGALAAARKSVDGNPESSDAWNLLGTIEASGLQPEAARKSLERAIALRPNQPRVLMSLGHVLKTIGDRAACEAAYLRAIELEPDLGEAWWSLADLKNYTFSEAQLDRMREAAESPSSNLQPSDHAGFHFALAKALEDRGEDLEAFHHYARGNALKHQAEPFDMDAFEAKRTRIQTVFSAEYTAQLPQRSEGVRPIFVVGLPRSGSTLIEQILASHSQVDGTMELPHILNYVRELNRDDGYPESAATLSRSQLDQLGERYLKETEPYRGNAPVFVDKMPNNFTHVGLILSILPQAVIVDARRHPVDCCFSIYRQNFARGQTFSYDLTMLGRYYQAYLSLMAHWDAVLPGRIHRVIYEDMVADTETEIRRLLAHCGLPFEDGCLKFYDNDRAVRTASAEQVRQPITDRSIGRWRRFESQLEPLLTALDATGNGAI